MILKINNVKKIPEFGQIVFILMNLKEPDNFL